MESTELCSPSRTAQELLLEFKASGRQEPFEEIVRRYAGMVYHVCLRITKNNHDAEDATQAVFLTLAVQARQNKEIRYIGPWLQQVAHRLSLDLRKSKKRREKREERHGQKAGDQSVENEGAEQLHFEEMKGVINQEINKLPPKYRVPLIMYYFGGLSREEMAKELQCKPGTLGVRLHRAREMLGERLSRRGVAMTEGTMSLAVAYAVQSVVAEHIISNTCQAATHIVAGNPMTSHLVPAQLVALARGAVHSVLMAKVKTVAALLVAMGCAMAAGAEVVSKVTPIDLGLDLQLRIGDWVKEHLMPFSTPIQVNATRESAASDQVASVTPGPVAYVGSGTFSLDGRELEVRPVTTTVQTPHEPPVGGGSAGVEGAAGHGTDLRQALTTRSNGEHDMPRRFPGSWGGLASQTRGPAPVPVRDFAPPYNGGSFRAGNAPPVLPAGVTVVRDGERERRPRLAGPTTTQGPWRPQSPVGPGGGFNGEGRANGGVDNGGGRPNKPPKPGDGGGGSNNGGTNNNGGGGGKDGPRRPVQVVVTNSDPVSLFLEQHASASAPNVPRSPVSRQASAGGGLPIPMSGTQTRVDYASGNGAVLDVSSSAYDRALNGSILLSDSDFSGSSWNAPTKVDLFNASDATTITRYTEGTFLKLDPQIQKLVIVGRQSRAKLTGVTVESTAGRLSGYGVVGPAETLDQSGQLIADGLGEPRVLDLSGIGAIRNGTENAGANGWYARNGGKVVLPEIRVLPGTREYTWGEDATDAQIDLVNSVRLQIKEARSSGRLKIALSAADRGDVPPLPGGNHAIGVWEIDAGGLVSKGTDLTVRYDDGLVADLGKSESVLRLWGYGGGMWKPIEAGFALDTEANTVRGSVGSVTFFAVATTPEPGVLGVVVGASLLMLRRRRGA